MADVSETTDQLIRVMPAALANKIAAGEVVQRPASVLKELLENALDAGAGSIDVHLKRAGSDLVQVVDDGCGMGPHDAALCFQRHATSKVQSIEDLMRIQTLGFRGEALASIAAVARVELKSRRQGDAAGVRVRVEGSEQAEAQPCAAPAGTSIAVRNLFYNVPARRNFLKTPATELKHCIETFQQLALANPRVGFTLTHNGNELYRLVPHRNRDPFEGLQGRIVALFGDEHQQHLVPVDDTLSYLSVYGYVSAPEFNRRSRGEQFLFVNGRYVQSRYLSHAVKTAYGDMLPDGVFPFFALTLKLDPARVDVNVHPTKAEVKFEDEQGVYSALRTVVKRALGRSDVTPLFAETSTEADVDEAEAPAGDADDADGFSMPAMPPRGFAPMRRSGGPGDASTQAPFRPRSSRSRHESSSGRSRPAAWQDLGDLTEQLYRQPAQSTPPTEQERTQPMADEQPAAAKPSLCWQVGERYIMTPTDAGLMLVDQQAAHRRILYERALHHLQQEAGDSQQLLFPQTVELNPADYALLEELLPDLRALGFDLEPFSGRSVMVRGVPADVRSGSEASMLEEVLEQFQHNRNELRLKGRENLAKSIAQRGAIRPGVRLSPEEMQALLRRLFQCEMPYASPTGQTTIIKISLEELDKRFGR